MRGSGFAAFGEWQCEQCVLKSVRPATTAEGSPRNGLVLLGGGAAATAARGAVGSGTSRSTGVSRGK
ncbi:MAG: hypothetical protein DMD93_11710 [Candidatus Rokuibacteriota bacterium]|nr:MAG: hypothetical protein DMD93_11710 [Candidatus Rokubacteria bacterium]